jgi:hypothetical protein
VIVTIATIGIQNEYDQFNINLAIIISLFTAIFVVLSRKIWNKGKEGGAMKYSPYNDFTH